MQTNNLILLWIFIFQGKMVKGLIGFVFLNCKKPPPAVSESNMTIECHINSTAFHQYNCSLQNMLCFYNKETKSCEVKAYEQDPNENKIHHVTVEISNVKSGTYTLIMNTDCGDLEPHTFDVAETASLKEAPQPEVIGPVLGFSALVILVLVGVVGMCIYKRRKQASRYQSPTNNPDPEAVAG